MSVRERLQRLGRRLDRIPDAAAAPVPVPLGPAPGPARGGRLRPGQLRSALMAPMMAGPAGGLPEPRPDQVITPSAAGIAPGTASGTFRGRYVIVYGTAPGNGIFVYSGPPGLGNLVASIVAPGVTHDLYGNPVQAVAQFGPGFVISSQGDLTISNNAGTPVFFAWHGDGSFRFYDSTGIAAGHLKVAIAPVAGTDGVGNPYSQGMTVFGANGAPVGIAMPTTNPRETFNAFLAAGVNSPGGGANVEQGYLELVAPQWTGAADFCMEVIFGPKLSSPASSQGQLIYSDTAAVQHAEATWGQGGIFIPLCNGIVAVAPGTADTTLASETWHALPLAAGWSNVGGQPVIQYRLLPDGSCQWAGVATHAAFTTATQLNTAASLPAAYRPGTRQFVAGPVQATTVNPDAGLDVRNTGDIFAYTNGVSTTSCRVTGTHIPGL